MGHKTWQNWIGSSSDKINKGIRKYDGKKGVDKLVSIICLQNKKCSCAWYLERAICKHFVAAKMQKEPTIKKIG